ncbi:MAG: putative DNA-binding transcriptional regulator YafY [Saprospiraceae bacterium]|jgi:predicted DNA-binding transcriptional regulator YafY
MNTYYATILRRFVFSLSNYFSSMAQNKNALIRYRIIDKCLQNSYRRWTLNDLITACSDALYEYEGKDVSVSKRTVQLDIQVMRSNKLGYNAPIVVYEKRYYKYGNLNYTITDIPVTETDMKTLSEAVEILKQFKDFSLFSELGGIIHRLEDKVYTEKTKQPAIIHLDKNENLKGLHHLDTLYQAILKKVVLKINYQSFKAKRNDLEASELIFHPFILKEFNNRWFVIGKKEEHSRIVTLPLDRIQKIQFDLSVDYLDENFDADEYYKNTYGVTVLDEKHVMEIEFVANRNDAPYILTKPFHHSQKLLETYENGNMRFSISVHHNFEIERLFLSFGGGILVTKPRDFKRKIHWKLKKALERYEYNDDKI